MYNYENRTFAFPVSSCNEIHEFKLNTLLYQVKCAPMFMQHTVFHCIDKRILVAHNVIFSTDVKWNQSLFTMYYSQDTVN